jgi:Protein of unknown function (DUF2934)
MMPTRQEIQLRSYQIWEREGRPAGRDKEHWFRAERELAAEETAPKSVAARSPAGRATKAAPRTTRKKTTSRKS